MLTVGFWAAEDRGTPGLGREKEQQLVGRYLIMIYLVAWPLSIKFCLLPPIPIKIGTFSVLVTWVSLLWAEFAS